VRSLRLPCLVSRPLSPWDIVLQHALCRAITKYPFRVLSRIALLWIWKLRNDPEDRIAARFVNVLAIYFLLFVFIYARVRLAPSASGLGHVYPMMGAWLPLGYGFALVSHEEP